MFKLEAKRGLMGPAFLLFFTAVVHAAEGVKVHSGEIEQFAEAQKRVDESAPVVRANLAQGTPTGVIKRQGVQTRLLTNNDILCPGYNESDYCDCDYDCNANPAWCSCSEAEAEDCCNMTYMGSSYSYSYSYSYYSYSYYSFIYTAPTTSPIPAPTASPVPAPTTSPTSSPSMQTTYNCRDDSTWYKGNNPLKDCDWVSKNTNVRCGYKGNDGTYADESCQRSCGGCVPTPMPTAAWCEDSTTWYRTKASRNCDWVSKNTDNRCAKTGVDGTTGEESCLRACDNCPTACDDSTTWYLSAYETFKNCDWVSEKSDARCVKTGSDGTTAGESCSAACGGCVPTPVPSTAPTSSPTPCKDSTTWYRGKTW
eukprot:CAMPEP_0185765190 /NCGR_PEP_ID=MMETSP1174-20130828/26988_1 /TAXON_ID=35687 /ORGANISM="Dictyocha speculum, Strain CCMP1381" /LENGTH=366 /DNA_ID=CAMNT_0028448155 /DNA_START=109 /DNA_END=1206 /DNA_ORIENTATION=+